MRKCKDGKPAGSSSEPLGSTEDGLKAISRQLSLSGSTEMKEGVGDSTRFLLEPGRVREKVEGDGEVPQSRRGGRHAGGDGIILKGVLMVGGGPLPGHKLPGPGRLDWVEVNADSTRHPHSWG